MKVKDSVLSSVPRTVWSVEHNGFGLEVMSSGEVWSYSFHMRMEHAKPLLPLLYKKFGKGEITRLEVIDKKYLETSGHGLWIEASYITMGNVVEGATGAGDVQREANTFSQVLLEEISEAAGRNAPEENSGETQTKNRRSNNG